MAVRRVRSPRYAIALGLGVVYVWSFLIRPVNSGSLSEFLGQPTEMIVTLLIVLTLMSSWVFGADTTALAFSQAELSFLFPAPLSRRALIGYKLSRAQIAVVINVLIWVFILRRGGTALPSPLRAVGIWLLFSTLNFHRLGAALVRSSWREHGRVAVRRHRWSIAFFVVLGLALLAGLVNGREALKAADGTAEFLAALGHILSVPPASIGLYPFHLIVAPTFARNVAEWSSVVWPALVMALIHVWWVWRTDTAFEDAAIEASAERARRIDVMRTRRTIGAINPPRAAKSTLRLASVGHPALAIFWKNMLCLRRTVQIHVFVGPVAMAVIIGPAASGGGADVGEMVALGALVLVAMLLLFGGRLIRNDLRADMQHLPLIKSLPIAPGEIVLAEVASSAVPMAVFQIVLLAIVYVATLASHTTPLALHASAAAIIVTPIAVIALNAAVLTIQNGTAVLFPAWVRLGPTVNSGVEALGQNLLATIAMLLSLAIGMIPAGLAAWGVVALVSNQPRESWPLGVVVAATVLGAETYAAMRLLGRALARAEPSQVA